MRRSRVLRAVVSSVIKESRPVRVAKVAFIQSVRQWCRCVRACVRAYVRACVRACVTYVALLLLIVGDPASCAQPPHGPRDVRPHAGKSRITRMWAVIYWARILSERHNTSSLCTMETSLVPFLATLMQLEQSQLLDLFTGFERCLSVVLAFSAACEPMLHLPSYVELCSDFTSISANFVLFMRIFAQNFRALCAPF